MPRKTSADRRQETIGRPKMMKRAGYDIRLAEGDFHCGGCGGEICRGDEYGSSGMMICEGCIEVIEEDEMSFVPMEQQEIISDLFAEWVAPDTKYLSPQEIIADGREQLTQNIRNLCNDRSYSWDAYYVGPAAQREVVQRIWDEAVKRTARTFTCKEIEVADLGAIDLRLAGVAITDAKAYRITIYDDQGMNPEAETAEALYSPEDGRLGIAWGASATWADVESVEDGIEEWLNDPEGEWA